MILSWWIVEWDDEFISLVLYSILEWIKRIFRYIWWTKGNVKSGQKRSLLLIFFIFRNWNFPWTRNVCAFFFNSKMKKCLCDRKIQMNYMHFWRFLNSSISHFKVWSLVKMVMVMVTESNPHVTNTNRRIRQSVIQLVS